ncbi:hypothetical protein caldi_33350 [Caldinitratiruptor microaerophilus]|uniref:Uncharacterized protein n=1 Tax=Caldinitratiruptor microaerophilus TaxID=671077 RepID=A0AA35CR30_9FIRM|nr:hypothetical protein caldi_33350 [Caldinitratiruptor microaerophilus]
MRAMRYALPPFPLLDPRPGGPQAGGHPERHKARDPELPAGGAPGRGARNAQPRPPGAGSADLESAWSGVQPCFCLCFGFSQMIITRPLRRMTLHFSQMGLTDGRTFNVFPPPHGPESGRSPVT